MTETFDDSKVVRYGNKRNTETFDDSYLSCYNNETFAFTKYDMPDKTTRINRESKIGEIIAFRTCDGKYVRGELNAVKPRIGNRVDAIPQSIIVDGVSYFTTSGDKGDSLSIKNTVKIDFQNQRVIVWHIKDEIGEFLE